MEHTRLSHAHIDEYANLSIVGCYKHEEGIGPQGAAASIPRLDIIERELNRRISSPFTLDTSVTIIDDEHSGTVICIKLEDSIFKYQEVKDGLHTLTSKFGCKTSFSEECSRVLISRHADELPDLPPFSSPIITYEAHCPDHVDFISLKSSLKNIEVTYEEFGKKKEFTERIDVDMGDQNRVYVFCDGSCTSFTDANRITTLVDSMFSSKHIQYNGVFISMFDSPRQKEL